MDSGQITLVTAVSSSHQENDQMRKRSCSRVSEMLSRNRRVPHLMEIYPGASDLHMLLGRRRTGDLQGYPALTHMWLCHIRITTQAEHSPKKGGETKLRSCGSLRTEKSTKTDSKARNGVLITWHTGMAAPTASPNLW